MVGKNGSLFLSNKRCEDVEKDVTHGPPGHRWDSGGPVETRDVAWEDQPPRFQSGV